METQRKTLPVFKRVIRLSPAIADWTTLKALKKEPELQQSGVFGFDRLSEADIRRAHLIHYQLGNSWQQSLRSALEIKVQYFSAIAEQSTYGGFLDSTQNRSFIHCEVSAKNLPSPITLCLELSLAEIMINCIIGNPQTVGAQAAALTDIEREILSPILDNLVKFINQAWRGMLEAPAWQIVSSPSVKIDRTIGVVEAYTTFSLEISIGDFLPDTVILGYTHETLKRLLELYHKHPKERALNTERLTDPLLKNIAVPVQSELATTQLTTEEIKSLQKGDIICLDVPIDSPVPVTIGKAISFPGRLGTQHGKLSLEITSAQAKAKSDILLSPAAPETKEYFPEAEENPAPEETVVAEEPEELVSAAEPETKELEAEEPAAVPATEEPGEPGPDFGTFEAEAESSRTEETTETQEEEEEKEEEETESDDFSFPDFLDEEESEEK